MSGLSFSGRRFLTKIAAPADLKSEDEVILKNMAGNDVSFFYCFELLRNGINFVLNEPILR